MVDFRRIIDKKQIVTKFLNIDIIILINPKNSHPTLTLVTFDYQKLLLLTNNLHLQLFIVQLFHIIFHHNFINLLIGGNQLQIGQKSICHNIILRIYNPMITIYIRIQKKFKGDGDKNDSDEKNGVDK